MRFGICTGPENIELLEKLGYDYIELNASKMLTLSEEELESIREKLNASKIKCEAVNVLFPKTMSIIGGTTTEEELTEFLHKVMKIIQFLGAKVAVFGSGKSEKMSRASGVGTGVSGTGEKSSSDWRNCRTVWSKNCNRTIKPCRNKPDQYHVGGSYLRIRCCT